MCSRIVAQNQASERRRRRCNRSSRGPFANEPRSPSNPTTRPVPVLQQNAVRNKTPCAAGPSGAPPRRPLAACATPAERPGPPAGRGRTLPLVSPVAEPTVTTVAAWRPDRACCLSTTCTHRAPAVLGRAVAPAPVPAPPVATQVSEIRFPKQTIAVLARGFALFRRRRHGRHPGHTAPVHRAVSLSHRSFGDARRPWPRRPAAGHHSPPAVDPAAVEPAWPRRPRLATRDCPAPLAVDDHPPRPSRPPRRPSGAGDHRAPHQ